MGVARTARQHHRNPDTSRRCSVCANAAVGPAALADLNTIWLVADSRGVVTGRRYCQGCAPTGPVDGVECVVCGDGPLLAGTLASPDLIASAAIESWLAETGWSPSGPCCPTCIPTRPPSTRRHGIRPATPNRVS